MGYRVVDFFAGIGGFTAGVTAAGGDVVCAINHWPLAVEMHAANHPGITHHCEDLARFSPKRLPRHDVLVASPACQGHSPARGSCEDSEGDGHWDVDRATAWSVIDTAEARRPLGIIVENVPRFLKWKLYPMWEGSLKALGYNVRVQIVDSQNFGVCQSRPRAIIMAAFGSRKAPKIEIPNTPLVPVSTVLAFGTGKWSDITRPGRSPATLARVARGRREVGDRFVMPYNGSGSGLTGRSIDRPIGTITAADRWAVVDGERMRMLTIDEIRACMGFDESYRVPSERDDATKMLGNAIVPVVAKAAAAALFSVL